MEKIKLYELLQTFSKKEFEEFGLFLNSPFFNTGEKPLKLYDFIKSSYPDFHREGLSKENIFKKLYPSEQYKDKKIRDLFSATLSYAEDFLGYNKIKIEQFQMKTRSLEELSNRNLTKHMEQKYKEIDTALNKYSYKNETYFFYKHFIFHVKHNHIFYNEHAGKRNPLLKDTETEINYFVLYFISKMLDYYTIQLNEKKILKHEPHFELLNEVLSYLRTKNLEEYPEIFLLYKMLLLEVNPADTSVFFEIWRFADDESRKIDRYILISVYTHLYNHSRERYLKNHPDFSRNILTITQQILKRDLYPLVNGYIPVSNFITFFNYGLTLKEYDWAGDYLENYNGKLDPIERENTYTLCKAMLEYRLRNYDKSLNLLSRVKINDFNEALRVKITFIRTYFELKEYDAVLNVIDSFRHYWKANKEIIPDYIYIRVGPLLNFLTRVINAIHHENNESLAMLGEEIQNSEVFEIRQWLLEQISELLKDS